MYSPPPLRPLNRNGHPYPPYPSSGFDRQYEAGRDDYRPTYVEKDLHPINRNLHHEDQKPNHTKQADKTRRGDDLKGAAAATSENRFVLPRIAGTGPDHRTARVPESSKPPVQSDKSELEAALDKLDLLKKRKEDASRAKDVALESDLTYYAIPDLEQRIQRLRRAQEDEKKTPPSKPERGPRAEVETDSGSSEDSDEEIAELNNSDIDLYE